jgi:hypothetical protein
MVDMALLLELCKPINRNNNGIVAIMPIASAFSEKYKLAKGLISLSQPITIAIMIKDASK